MKEDGFCKQYVSSTNTINEAVIVGTILVPVFIIGLFTDVVTPEKLAMVRDLCALCFGIGGAKAGLSFFAGRK